LELRIADSLSTLHMPRNSQFAIPNSRLILGSFLHFATLYAGGTDFYSACSSPGELHADRLQVRVETTWSPVVCVGDIISELRSLPADFAAFGHGN